MTTYKTWGSTAAIALTAAFVVLGLTMTASAVSATIAYDAIPGALPPNVASLGFQATQTNEFGDYVHLASGTNRILNTVTVTMSDWALASTPANVAFCAASLSNCDGTGFFWPLTVNVYSNSLDANGVPDTLLATKTITTHIPWRPEADPTCAGGTAWRAGDNNCYNGFAFNASFDMSDLDVTLPDDVIVGIAYNTQIWGAAPTGVDGPYNSLNVGVASGQTASAGTDDNANNIFWSTETPGNYTDGGAGGIGIFRQDTNWNPNGTVNLQITTTAPEPGSIHIKKYECTEGTTVVRSANGVGGTVPGTCSVQEGASFGLVHGSQTDAEAPYPELNGPFVDTYGDTDVNGDLTIEDLDTTGRYLVVETDGNGNQLAAGDILGLYCEGDGDESDNNDNQELTFVSPGNTVECVAYNKAAPLPTSVKVTIVKYLDGEPADAGVESANGTSFPMHAIFPGGEGDYSLGPVGFNNPNPYQATTADMPVHSAYSTYETASEECTESYPWELAGYSVGETYEDAQQADVVDTVPAFADLTSDMFVIVHNQNCDTPEPPMCPLDPMVSDATTMAGESAAVVVTPHNSWTTLEGASWIWNTEENGNTDDAVVGDVDFTKTFEIAGTPTDSQIEISADNGFKVVVNGTEVVDDQDAQNWSEVRTVAIPASALVTGSNTITITVTNQPKPEGYDGPNPGGLLYKLTINQNCEGDGEGEPGSEVKVHLYKYLEDGMGSAQVPDDSTLAPFPMKATWSAVINGSASVGSDVSYVLGDYHGGAALKYAADTSAMQSSVIYYSSYEDTSEGSQVLPIGATCVADKFRLAGYKSGTSLSAAQSASLSETAPVFENFSADQYVIVVNEDCDDVIASQMSTVTMCKVDDTGATPLGGWTLTLKGDSIEDLVVPTNSSAGINSTNLLGSGTSYLATVAGSWLNQGGANPADAEFSSTDGWSTHMDGYTTPTDYGHRHTRPARRH